MMTWSLRASALMAPHRPLIQEDPNPRVRIHMAHIHPDVTMGDLLKETPSSQLFTVFGAPRTTIETTGDGHYIVKMEGVDIYNPSREHGEFRRR